jgi:aerobic-type carbon monoxide dehydrogenase small subunit (CoxS/CutS family)
LKEGVDVKEISPNKNLCPYCFTVFGTFEEMKGHVISVHKTEPLPKPEGLIGLMVNGQAHELMVEPEWTLYRVIHDRLGLTGVKMFCDRGACGSCTVIMDGRPILSCMTLAIECDGKTIETAEGIAQANHPLVESYVKHHTMQCGYCTPGFITTAKALLDRNSDPTEEEIVEALGGNLCRCGTYPQHPKAILEAAKMLKEEGSK